MDKKNRVLVGLVLSVGLFASVSVQDSSAKQISQTHRYIVHTKSESQKQNVKQHFKVKRTLKDNTYSLDLTAQDAKELKKSGVSIREAHVYELIQEVEGVKKKTWQYSNSQNRHAGQHTVVAVLDTGIDSTHDEFQGIESPRLSAQKVNRLGLPGQFLTAKIPYSYNYVDKTNEFSEQTDVPDGHHHGTHVAGLIAGNKEVVSYAPQAQLLNMKVFGNKTSVAKEDDIAQAIYDAIKLGADVMNLSLGSPNGEVDEEDEMQKAIVEATKQGILVVCAAGNSGARVTNSDSSTGKLVDESMISSPSVVKDAISVASLGGYSKPNSPSYFTSLGPTTDLQLKPEIAETGYEVSSSIDGNKYDAKSGTSMATPIVSGKLASIVFALRQKLGTQNFVKKVKTLLLNQSENVPSAYNENPAPLQQAGAGKINLEKMLQTKMLVTDAKDQDAVLDLGEVGRTKEEWIEIKNTSRHTKNYTISVENIFINALDNESHQILEETTEANVHFSEENFSVPAHQSKKVKVTFSINEAIDKHFIEGKIKVSSSGDSSTIPVLGYVGEYQNKGLIDTDFEKEDAILYKLSPYYYLGYTRKILPTDPINELDFPDERFEHQSIFSPNGDGYKDAMAPIIYAITSLKSLEFHVEDVDGNVLKTFETLEDIYYNTHIVSKDFLWDGLDAEHKAYPDGKYYYVTHAVGIDGSEERVKYPVYIDNTPPVVSIVGLYFTGISYDLREKYKLHLDIQEANHLTLTNTWTNYTSESEKGDGIHDFDINNMRMQYPKIYDFQVDEDSYLEEFQTLPVHSNLQPWKNIGNAINQIKFGGISDEAGNFCIPQKGIYPTLNVANAPKNLTLFNVDYKGITEIDSTNPDYHAATKTFTVHGYAPDGRAMNADTYKNAKVVNAQTGEFEMEIPLDKRISITDESAETVFDVEVHLN